MEPVFDSGTALLWWIIGGAIIFFVAIIFAYIGIKKIKQLFRGRDMLGMSREDVKKRWAQIEELLARTDEMSYKLAVMEADKLLDHALKAKFFPGTSLGERLRAAGYKYPAIRNVWPAHLTRNKLVHEANYHLDERTARNAITQFKRALAELGAL